MENISENINYKEACFSVNATRLGIDNIPTPIQTERMREVAQNVFEPLREAMSGKPIFISSFFRSEKLNKKIGGATKSQHMEGQAMDIDNDTTKYGATNKEIFNYIKNNLEFDKLINELPDEDGSPSWVHVSFVKGNNRKQVMTSRMINGKTIYEIG